MSTKPRFGQLARAISSARQQAQLTQGGLARVLGIKQQSVSRWEAGTHRPGIDQMAALARALDLDEASLLRLAGIDTAPVLAVAPHFPLNMLAPEMFERFIADLASHLYPERRVRVLGGRGHDQGGWDVLVTGDGPVIGIQCKQVARFGPAEAKRAIAAVDRAVDRSVLALSRIVSPATAETFEAAGWEVWDQDDISRKVRQLGGEQQDKLVDNFFRGQRRVLLGRDDPGPWVKPDRFFAPFDKVGGAFSHSWQLMGRDADLARLAEALEGDERVVIVSAPGGMGKSRLVKAGVERYSAAHPSTLIRFLSPVGEPNQVNLENLGFGPKLLVIDDAHDRDGLPVLIDYVADPHHQARLLLATRPYAEQRIRNDLARFAIFSPATINLAALSKTAMRGLASHALETFGGDTGWADIVLHIARENPLVAVMAARVVSEQPLSPEMVRGADDIRAVVIEKFTQVLTGKIGQPEDARLLRDMLGLIALLQPVQIDDRQIGDLLEGVTTHRAADASRALKLLIEGGVLYKRSRHYRLMPDLLGDYLIDDICIQNDGRLSLFAERVLEAVDDRLLSQVMLNLGRLDWRRSGGDPTGSTLLDSAWARFRDIEHEWDPRIDAVRAVAIYQPAQALRFVGERLRAGKGFRAVAPILENIAYTERYRAEALKLLWEMGQGDVRDTGPHPSHPIRVLAELCEFGEHKPFAFSEEVADFALALMDDDRAWDGPQTPLAIVAPILKGTIDQSHSSGRTITLSTAFVNYDYARPLRARIIDKILALLEHPKPRVAATAARYLHEALHMPYGIGGASPDGEMRAQYDREFTATIDRVADAMKRGVLATTTVLAAAESVSWHADYGKGLPGDAASRMLAALPTDLDFRLRAAMVDRARFAFRGQTDALEWEDQVDTWLQRLADELLARWQEPETLLDQLEAAIRDLNEAGIGDGSSYMLINTLLGDRLPLARALVSRAEADFHSPYRAHVRLAVIQLLNQTPAEGRRVIERGFERDSDLAWRAVTALGSLQRPLERADLALLRRAVASENLQTSRSALGTLRWMKDLPEAQVKAIAMLAPIEREPDLLGDLASLLLERRRKLVSLLTVGDVEALLARMRDIQSFEGHWVESLMGELAEHFPEPFAEFLFQRTDRALGSEEGRIELLGYRFHEGKLGFHKAANAASVLDRAWAWLRRHDNDDGYKVYRVAELFAGMFDIDDNLVVEFLDAKLEGATAIELKWIAKLLRHTDHDFPFKQRRFVERCLDRCAAAGSDVLDRAISDLGAAAMSGMKSGTLGEPMPRDLAARDAAKAVLSAMPRLSPAYPLYEAILRDAERDIARSIREGEALDAEEAE